MKAFALASSSLSRSTPDSYHSVRKGIGKQVRCWYTGIVWKRTQASTSTILKRCAPSLSLAGRYEAVAGVPNSTGKIEMDTKSGTEMKRFHEGLTQRVDASIERAIVSEHLVGTVVLIAQNGEVIYQHSLRFMSSTITL